ncbi:MAG: hypothetical protein IKU11_01630, partial [Clostridia bacterium]|nr:hypothetical protein [Clostridia bacterium]
SVKKLIPKGERGKDLDTLEAEYLETHPDSGYLTEVVGLKYFPDYLDYLPKGAIVRKVNVMGTLPRREIGPFSFVAISRGEYAAFLDRAAGLTVQGILR